jgi:hypothetical protein
MKTKFQPESSLYQHLTETLKAVKAPVQEQYLPARSLLQHQQFQEY